MNTEKFIQFLTSTQVFVLLLIIALFLILRTNPQSKRSRKAVSH